MEWVRAPEQCAHTAAHSNQRVPLPWRNEDSTVGHEDALKRQALLVPLQPVLARGHRTVTLLAACPTTHGRRVARSLLHSCTDLLCARTLSCFSHVTALTAFTALTALTAHAACMQLTAHSSSSSGSSPLHRRVYRYPCIPCTPDRSSIDILPGRVISLHLASSDLMPTTPWTPATRQARQSATAVGFN